MTPKKGGRSNRKNTQNLQSVRTEKKLSNKPNILKVSIPRITEQEGVHVPIVRGRRPPQYTRHLDTDTKVDLANTVARQQLVKEEPPALQTDNVVIINCRKLRGRKKKVVENNTPALTPQTITLRDTMLPKRQVPEKKARPTRRLTRKRLADSKALEDLKRAKLEPKIKIESLDVTIKLEDNADGLDIPVEYFCEPLLEPQDEVLPQTPVVVQTRPTVVQPTPTVVQTTPVFVQPTPAVVRLTPTVARPTPKVVQPKPTVGQNTQSKRTVVQLKPTFAQPLPIVVQPTPIVAQPTPTVVKPESQVLQPPPKKTKPQVKRLQFAAKKLPIVERCRRTRGPKSTQQSVQAHIQTPPIFDVLINKVSETVVQPSEIQQNEPRLVESRKNSIGSSSNKSWTRDISSSSNNTCVASVCSNDFVRINKKLPVLKLTSIDSEVKKRQNEAQAIAASAFVDETSDDEDLPDSDDTDSTLSEEKFSEQLKTNDSLVANSLHLSVSSSSQLTLPSKKYLTTDKVTESIKDYTLAADKLSLTMEKLDLEIIKWMNSDIEDVNANLDKFTDKMFCILDREFGVITHCRHLKEMLNPKEDDDSFDETFTSMQVQDCDSNNDIDNVDENSPTEEIAPVKEKTPVVEDTPVENTTDTEEPRRRPSRHLSSASEGNISNASTKASKDDEMPADTYEQQDDDDALSLFAESICGFETARMNLSTVPVDVPKSCPAEEYIPKSLNEDTPNIKKQIHCPIIVKLSEDMEPEPEQTSKAIAVCEKQNADSTSIYKQSISTDDAESYQDITENVDLDARLGALNMIKQPRLMESYIELHPKARSVVFSNICFYNLFNSCRNVYQCRFLHLIPTSEQVTEKLKHLDERMLIQEYLLLKKWTELRRRYGMCYVVEFANRGLTRILIEIAYDFIINARSDSEADTRLRVDTIETALLHLNNVDLSICEDLLKLPIHSEQGNKTLLCDVFMATMSITQNFSRFKIVFLTLTYFMVDSDRTFNKDVVEHILERVCIFPFDEPVARALIQMMRLTKSDIFNNSMIRLFEKQISGNKNVFDEYMLLKNHCAFSSMLVSSAMSGSPPVDGRTPDADLPPAASPDTTKVENMNNPVAEPPKPVITRTIGMNPVTPAIFNQLAASPGDSQAHVSPCSSKSYINYGPSRVSDSSDGSVQVNMKTWRNRAILPQYLRHPMPNRGPPRCTFRGTPPRGDMMPPMRPQMSPQGLPFNQRLVTFNGPSNFVQRQRGPNH